MSKREGNSRFCGVTEITGAPRSVLLRSPMASIGRADGAIAAVGWNYAPWAPWSVAVASWATMKGTTAWRLGA